MSFISSSGNYCSRYYARFTRLLILATGFALFLSPQSYADPLPPKEVFKPEIRQILQDGIYQTEVIIHFPPDYYLYRDKTHLLPDNSAIRVSEIWRSPGVEFFDAFFGRQQVWNQGEGHIRIRHREAGKSFTLKAQGCEKGGICYPPQNWKLQVRDENSADLNAMLPVQPLELTSLNVKQNEQASSLNQLFQPPSNRQNALLDEKLAFHTEVFSEPDGRIRIHWNIAEGTYLYRSSIKIDPQGYPISDKELSEGVEHEDAHKGKQIVYFNEADVSFMLADPPPAGDIIQITVEFQGCAAIGVCYPVIRRTLPAISPGRLTGQRSTSNSEQALKQANDQAKPNAVRKSSATDNTGHTLPEPGKKADRSTGEKLDNLLEKQLSHNIFTALPLIFLMGILVSFTGCAYPMIPIISSLVIGENTGRRNALRLLGVYVLAMAFTFAIIGWVFGLMEINLQVWAQKPIFYLIAALIFILLGLSMCEIYSLQLPAFIRNHAENLSRRQKSGSFTGAAVMGALSVLIVSPCATPVLALLLFYALQISPLKASLALWFFGLGMGLPLLLFGALWREFMPKQGHWMNTIKYIFAAFMFGLAIYMLSRIFSPFLSRIIWSVYLLSCAILIRPFGIPLTPWAFIRQIIAWLFLFAAAFAFFTAAQIHWGVSGSHSLAKQSYNQFTYVKNLAETKQNIQQSKLPVLLDFYADWCSNCQEWERDIWHNPRFADLDQNYKLLKVDASDFNDDYKAIFSHYQLIGPPAVLFFPAGNIEEIREKRIIGSLSADDFAQMVEK